MNEYITKISHPIETIEKEGRLNRFSHKTKAKTFRDWVSAWIGVHSKRGNMDMVFVFQEVLKAYNYYEPRKEIQVDAKQWKGKSSIEILQEVDKLVIIKYQKETPESEPKEIRTEVTREELQALVSAIKILSTNNNMGIETRDLALIYCSRMNLLQFDNLKGESFWKEFFNSRSLHNKFTIMLNALQELDFIEYKSGRTKLLNKDISLQLLLPN